MSAVMYEEMRCVGSNDHVARSTPSATPAAWGAGVGELLMTFQCAGAVTVKRKDALRSGCSNTAYMRRESGTSNCV